MPSNDGSRDGSLRGSLFPVEAFASNTVIVVGFVVAVGGGGGLVVGFVVVVVDVEKYVCFI